MAVVTRTFTRVHNVTVPANPFLYCNRCGSRVEAFHDGRCGCALPGGRLLLTPCFHRGDYRSACPSWSPIDGCSCKAGQHG